jgi:hypothetical protein
MLVATFNATTGWAGREITWQDERFTLDGHGPITAADVMEYDRQGHLDWPSEEMRSWVAARLAWEQAAVAPAQPVTPAQQAAFAQPVTPTQPVTPVTPTQPMTPMQPVTPAQAGGEPVAQAAAEPAAQPATEPAAATADEVYDLLAPAGDIVDAVGTATYQEALGLIADARPDASLHVEKWAHLIPEPENPWDRNAVAVYVDGRKVGYLPREHTAAYASLLGQIWTNYHGRAVCRAVVGGGLNEVTSQVGTTTPVDEAQYGVKLALATPEHFAGTHDMKMLTAEELAAGPPPV